MKSQITRNRILESPEEVKNDSGFIEIRDLILSGAVDEADSEYVKALLNAGANPNYQHPWADSLLHDLVHCFMSRRTLHGSEILRTARILLENGANPNIVGCNNLMPINVAKAHDAREFVLLLLEYGAKPNGSPVV